MSNEAPSTEQDDMLSLTHSINLNARISPILMSQVNHIRLNLDTGALLSFPDPSSPENLDEWIDSIELTLKDGGISRSEWSDAAILFLDKDGDANRAMRSLRDLRVQQGFDVWAWEEFIEALRDFLVERDARAFSLQTLRKDHPIATTVAGSLVMAAISPPLFVATLNVLGFGSGGVVTGSVAAGAQSMFYGGATTGLFAACQSAGAAGLGAAATTFTSAVGGAAGFKLFGKREKGESNQATSDANR